ncbi:MULTISPECIES: hypothetical protein [unclassified Streptomyces]|uniref:hypothetical protein n=1 Tax=unclassified Streptomyces TaxID=2593676 RepID=UPI0007111E11|nr:MULTISPECIES: hypothetical protein [unclassified Streptomyces]KRD17555.1 hypothetical protein ASE41_23035 [Streptomyces sp. Root264]
MGIESDQVVYEYLSRVGDVAQQRQLSSATRMRLVSELRNEIDRRRAKAPVDSPAAVRRIIDRLGSPDDLVAAAADGGGVPRTPTPSVPVQRDRDAQPDRPRQQKQPKQQKQPRQEKQPEPTGDPEQPKQDRRPERPERPERPKGIRRIVPRPRTGTPPPAGVPSDAASPPHRAPAHELGDGGSGPDWWLNEPTPFGPGEDIPGFVGGVEIPDLLKPPPRRKPEDDADDESDAVEEGAAPDDDTPAAPARRRRLRLPRTAGAPGRRWSNPLLLIAAGCLVAGAVLGNWFVLILGWLIAYASRRLTERETKAAVFWLPGLALTAGLVWLWGRSEGRWGAPVAEGHMSDAIADTWPWVVRGAAVASALFLAWRSQRQR